MNPLTLRPYTQNDLPALCAIWNEVVAAGDAFPQEDCLTPETGAAFFAGQSYCGVACDEAGQLLGLYILHPNNVGHCGHLCNASYAVSASARGRGVGRQLDVEFDPVAGGAGGLEGAQRVLRRAVRAPEPAVRDRRVEEEVPGLAEAVPHRTCTTASTSTAKFMGRR